MKKINTELAKNILHELSRQPLGKTELEKHTVQKTSITHTVFEGTFSRLVHGNYVEKYIKISSQIRYDC